MNVMVIDHIGVEHLRILSTVKWGLFIQFGGVEISPVPIWFDRMHSVIRRKELNATIPRIVLMIYTLTLMRKNRVPYTAFF